MQTKTFTAGGADFQYHSLADLEKQGSDISSLPFSIKILLEQAMRKLDNFKVTEQHIQNLADWVKTKGNTDEEIPFCPSRIVLQDFTGVPTLVDLASLRDSMLKFGADPELINPQVPVDLIIDHSVQVDFSGTGDAAQKNIDKEFQRNQERYQFLKWGEKAFKNFRVYPPGAGIIHQINLEHLASVVHEKDGMCYPDTVVGTDSHTTMVNGVGVLGWGVGGIEAESAMLGQPIYMKIPEVIGFQIKGELPAGVTSTDLVLRITEMLRQKGVVEKFVEFYGKGLSNLGVADRATISNMSPEYGATMGYFPVDQRTLEYLQKTGRSSELVQKVEAYSKTQGLFRTDSTPDPVFSDVLELDLASVRPSLAGPKRPQDRILGKDLCKEWDNILSRPIKERGYQLSDAEKQKKSKIADSPNELKHGSIVIAAITSCTNTSNPSVMIAAGIVAKKASELGLQKKEWVKTSLAPGSRVVSDYLEAANLQQYLDNIGFQTVGYGCTTCIGNSGPLAPKIVDAIQKENIVATSILSGNRNFEGRIHGEVKANFLASPPLVVAYAIAGRIDINFESESLGTDQNGKEVFLKDIWPTKEEVMELEAIITPQMYRARYQTKQNYSPNWDKLQGTAEQVYNWDKDSTYIQNPPFFEDLTKDLPEIKPVKNARVLLKLGDSVTTDHISPAGAFKPETPAGEFLLSKGIVADNFNSYGSRRGNDKIMARGTFANVRIKNQLVAGSEGGVTIYFPTGEQMSVFDASQKYRDNNIPLIVIAGKEYGSGSSRDWAAKGPFLLGVKATIASSYERIHRSNLIGMGVLPLQFQDEKSAEDFGLTGEETLSILGLDNSIRPGQTLMLQADGQQIPVLCRLDTPVEVDYYRNGGILHTVLRNFVKKAA
jgi:aconitate hydratase